jgi:hypothetical protein
VAHAVVLPRFWLVEGQNCKRWENGVRGARLWAGLLGVEKPVVERVVFDEDEGVVVTTNHSWLCVGWSTRLL